MALQHWETAAPTIGRCPCGGNLRLVEDDDATPIVEAQCDRCTDMTGIQRASLSVSAAPLTAPAATPGSVADFGF